VAQVSGEVGERASELAERQSLKFYISLARKYSYQFGLGYPTIEPLIDWSSFQNPTQLSYNFALQNIRKKIEGSGPAGPWFESAVSIATFLDHVTPVL